METCFKRAKTRQVPENGEISSMGVACFYTVGNSFSPNPPGLVLWPLQDPAHRTLTPLLHKGASFVPKCHFFTPVSPPGVARVHSHGICSDAGAPRTRPQAHVWAEAIVGAPSIPSAPNPAKGPFVD